MQFLEGKLYYQDVKLKESLNIETKFKEFTQNIEDNWILIKTIFIITLIFII